MISVNKNSCVRSRRVWFGAFLLVAFVAALPHWTGAQQAVSNPDQVVDRIAAAENREIATIRHYSPIIETYIQEMRPDKEFGSVPSKDHYFLGLADFKKGVVDRSLLDKPKGAMEKLNPLSHLTEFFSAQYLSLIHI